MPTMKHTHSLSNGTKVDLEVTYEVIPSGAVIDLSATLADEPFNLDMLSADESVDLFVAVTDHARDANIMRVESQMDAFYNRGCGYDDAV